MNFHSMREYRQQTEQLLDLRNFYPEQCVFHWNGRDQIPIASRMLKMTHDSVAAVCVGCREDQCPVRQAPYESK